MLYNEIRVIVAGVDIPYIRLTLNNTTANITIQTKNIKGDLKEMIKYEPVPMMILLKNPDPYTLTNINVDEGITELQSIVLFEGLIYNIEYLKKGYSDLVTLNLKAMKLSQAILSDIKYTDISVNKAFANIDTTQTFALRNSSAKDTGNEKLIAVPDGSFHTSVSDIFLRRIVSGDNVERIRKPHHIYQYTIDNMLLPLGVSDNFSNDFELDLKPYLFYNSKYTNIYIPNNERKRLKELRNQSFYDVSVDKDTADYNLNPSIYSEILEVLPDFNYNRSSSDARIFLDEFLNLVSRTPKNIKYTRPSYSDYVPISQFRNVFSSFSTIEKLLSDDDLWYNDFMNSRLPSLPSGNPITNSKILSYFRNKGVRENNIFFKHRDLFIRYMYTGIYYLLSLLGTMFFEKRYVESSTKSIERFPLNKIFFDITNDVFQEVFSGEAKTTIEIRKQIYIYITASYFEAMMSFVNSLYTILEKYFFIGEDVSAMQSFIVNRYSKTSDPAKEKNTLLLLKTYDYLSSKTNQLRLKPTSKIYETILTKVNNQNTRKSEAENPYGISDIINATNFKRILTEQLCNYIYNIKADSSIYRYIEEESQLQTDNFSSLFSKYNLIRKDNTKFINNLIESFSSIQQRGVNVDEDTFIQSVSLALHTSIMEEIIPLVQGTFRNITTIISSGIAETVLGYNNVNKFEPIDVKVVIPTYLSSLDKSKVENLLSSNLDANQLKNSIRNVLKFVSDAKYDNSYEKVPMNYSLFDYKAARNINNYNMSKRWNSFSSLMTTGYKDPTTIFPTMKLNDFISYQKMVNNSVNTGRSSSFTLYRAVEKLYTNFWYEITSFVNTPLSKRILEDGTVNYTRPEIFLKPRLAGVMIPPKCNVMLLEDEDKFIKYNAATNVDKLLINYHQASEIIAGTSLNQFYVMDIFQINNKGPISAQEYNDYVRGLYFSASNMFLKSKFLYGLEKHENIDIGPEIDLIKRIKGKTEMSDLMHSSIEKDLLPNITRSTIEDFFDVNNILADPNLQDSNPEELYKKIDTIKLNFNIIDDTNFEYENLPYTFKKMSEALAPNLYVQPYSVFNKNTLPNNSIFSSNKIRYFTYSEYKRRLNDGININYANIIRAGFPGEITPFEEILKNNILNNTDFVYKINENVQNYFKTYYEAKNYFKRNNNEEALKELEKNSKKALDRETQKIKNKTEIFNQIIRSASYLENGKIISNTDDMDLEKMLLTQLEDIKKGELPININIFLYILINNIQASSSYAPYQTDAVDPNIRMDSILVDLSKSNNDITTSLIDKMGGFYSFILEDVINYFINMLFLLYFSEYVQQGVSPKGNNTTRITEIEKQKLFYFITNLMLQESSNIFQYLNYKIEGNDPNNFEIKFDLNRMSTEFIPLVKGLLKNKSVADSVLDYRTGKDTVVLFDYLENFIKYLYENREKKSISVLNLKSLFDYTMGSAVTADVEEDAPEGLADSVNQALTVSISRANAEKNTGTVLQKLSTEENNYKYTTFIHNFSVNQSTRCIYSKYTQVNGFVRAYPTFIEKRFESLSAKTIPELLKANVSGSIKDRGINNLPRVTLSATNNTQSVETGFLDIVALESGFANTKAIFFNKLKDEMNNLIATKTSDYMRLSVGNSTGEDLVGTAAEKYRFIHGDIYIYKGNVKPFIDYMYCQSLYTNFKYNINGKKLSKTMKRLIKSLYDIRGGLMHEMLLPFEKNDDGSNNKKESKYFSPNVNATDFYKELEFPVKSRSNECVVTSEFLKPRSTSLHIGNDYGFDNTKSDDYIKEGIELVAVSDGWFCLGMQTGGIVDNKEALGNNIIGYGMYGLFIPDYSKTLSSLPYSEGSVITPMYLYAHCNIFKTLEHWYNKYKNNEIDDDTEKFSEALIELFDDKATLKELSNIANSRIKYGKNSEDRNKSPILEKQYQLLIKETIPDIIKKMRQIKVKVKKGDIICFMGNSGSSGGPHLHLECRKIDVNLSKFSAGLKGGEIDRYYWDTNSKIQSQHEFYKTELSKSSSKLEFYRRNPYHPDLKEIKKRYKNLLFDDRVLALLGTRPSTFTTVAGQTTETAEYTKQNPIGTDQRDMPLWDLLNIDKDYTGAITRTDFLNTLDAIKFYIQQKLIEEVFGVQISPITLPYHDPYYIDGGMPFAIAYKNDIIFTKLNNTNTIATPEGIQQQLFFGKGLSLRYMLYYYLIFMKLILDKKIDQSYEAQFYQYPMFPLSIIEEYNETLFNFSSMNEEYNNMFGKINFAFNWMDYVYIKDPTTGTYDKFKNKVDAYDKLSNFIDTLDVEAFIFDRDNDLLLINFSNMMNITDDSSPLRNPTTTSNITGESLQLFDFRRWSPDNLFTLSDWYNKGFAYNNVSTGRKNFKEGIVYQPKVLVTYSANNKNSYYSSILNNFNKDFSGAEGLKSAPLLFQDWYNIFRNIRNTFNT